MENINMIHLKFNFRWVNLKFMPFFRFKFRFDDNPNSFSFFFVRFLKKTKRVYILSDLIFLLKSLGIIIINFLYRFILWFYEIKSYLKLKAHKFIENKSNYSLIKNGLFFINSYHFIHTNPITKFFLDMERFGKKEITSKEEKIEQDMLNKQEQNDPLLKYWKYLKTFYYHIW